MPELPSVPLLPDLGAAASSDATSSSDVYIRQVADIKDMLRESLSAAVTREEVMDAIVAHDIRTKNLEREAAVECRASKQVQFRDAG